MTIVLFSGSGRPQKVPVDWLETMQKNGCVGADAIDMKSAAPSFKEVTLRSKNEKGASEKRVAEIKAGSRGRGRWGAMPLPPMSIEDQEAKAITNLAMQMD